MIAAALALLLCPTALADARLDGTTGLVTAPTAETLPRGKVAISLAADAYAVDGAFQASALPFGAAMGMSRSTELGVSLTVDRAQSTLPGVAAGTLSMRVRQRLVYPGAKRPALAVEAGGSGFTGPWAADAAVVGSARVLGLDVHGGVGGRYSAARGFGGRGSFGLDRALSEGARGVAEVVVGLDGGGLEAAEARAGLRKRVGKRVYALAWAGGGIAEGNPWGGGGFAIDLYAVDPADSDRDDDGVRDWKDLCTFEPEDKDKFEDLDGCPDPDNDGDGIPDAEDPTPDGDAKSSIKFTDPTPRLRMRIHERRLPNDPE